MLERRRKRDSLIPWAWLALDAAVVYGTLHGAFWLRFSSGWFDTVLSLSDHSIYFHSFHLVVLIVVFFLRFYGLYRPSIQLTFAQETWRVFKAVIAGTLVFMAISFFVRDFTYSRAFFIIIVLSLAPTISTARFLLGLILMGVDQNRGSFRNVLVLGADENLQKLVRFYERNPRFATRIIGVLDDRLTEGSFEAGVPVLGKIDRLPEMLEKQHQVHEVVLALPGLSNEKVLKILHQCEKEMVSFRWIADIFGLITSKMQVSYLGHVSILSFMDSPLTEWENRVLKRTMDILVSLAALILFSPVFFIVALFVKLSSRGPVFFRQERLGEDGRRFLLIKFRTMQTDAESKTGPVWTKEDDDRRTGVGSFLRRNNLDELPQLWNVFVGDMSLVGPRPERPFFVSQFKEDIPRYMARHSIRSGITGWAQVNGLRGNTSIEERTKYDLYYIENWSLLLDIKILLMTFFARQNAY